MQTANCKIIINLMLKLQYSTTLYLKFGMFKQNFVSLINVTKVS